MECPTPLLPTLTAPIDLWPYKSWAKGNLARGEQKKKKARGWAERDGEKNRTEGGEKPRRQRTDEQKKPEEKQKKTEEKQGKQGNNIKKCRNTKTNNTQRAGEKKGSIHIDKDCPCHCFIPAKTKRQNNNRYPQ
jgi:hypothetical protein